MSPRVDAVIVTYHPDGGFAERLARVQKQVARAFVVDNTPGALPPALAGIETLPRTGANEGLAAALNRGMQAALADGASHVLLLDQDTIVDEDIVAGLLAGLGGEARVAVVGANARSHASGHVSGAREDQDFADVPTVITSGSLLDAEAYRAAGPFREDYFIEAIDLEYCLRLRRAGWRVRFATRPLMTHAAGRNEERTLAGRTILVANHPPWRYYYISRNLAHVLRAYARDEPRWAARAGLNLLKMSARVALFEDAKLRKVTRIVRGFGRGFTRRELDPKEGLPR